MDNRRIRFVLELPNPEDFRHTNHNPPRECSVRAHEGAHDQSYRQNWRALLLVVKAKLEAVRAGISTLEDVNAAGRCPDPTDLERHRLALWRPDVRPGRWVHPDRRKW